ncbi:MAG TPA: protein-glutamate O-methyltransferase CheR [Acidimicrobiales bacterium]|nr:protein-glutamate O-methyltransferase CheR [Acidimicrobiales bacterium]
MQPKATSTVGASRADLSASDLEFVRKLIRDRGGIELDADKGYLVVARLQKVVSALSLGTLDQLLAELRSGRRRDIEEAVLDAMTTNETLFFRDSHPFPTLAEKIIPQILADKGTDDLTIWCAAASSGQEPYSLAIVIQENFARLAREGKVRIIATDLSPSMIERCREGRYSRFEVSRGLPPEYLERYFVPDGNDYVVKDSLRSMVDARTLNLTGSLASLPRVDLVMLRNVLIYFSAQTKKEILNRIRTLLRPEGYLMLGGAESLVGLDTGYERISFDRTVVYRPG